MIILEPGSIRILEFEIYNIYDNGIKRDFITNPFIKVMYSRKCEAGEAWLSQGTCQVCNQNTFLLDAPPKVQMCENCKE